MASAVDSGPDLVVNGCWQIDGLCTCKWQTAKGPAMNYHLVQIERVTALLYKPELVVGTDNYLDPIIYCITLVDHSFLFLFSAFEESGMLESDEVL